MRNLLHKTVMSVAFILVMTLAFVGMNLSISHADSNGVWQTQIARENNLTRISGDVYPSGDVNESYLALKDDGKLFGIISCGDRCIIGSILVLSPFAVYFGLNIVFPFMRLIGF